MSEIIGNLLVPGAILTLTIIVILTFKFVASRYKKIPPNAVGIFYGRKYKYTNGEGKTQQRGFEVVSGGGRILLPLVE